jgi:hypothetical protein
MPDIDDLDVIRQLLTGKPPSRDVNDYVRSRLNAVVASAESHPAAGRLARRSFRSRRTVAGDPRWRHPRVALGWAAGVAALAAGAVALVAVVLPGAGRDGTAGSAILAADVVKHVDRALSTAEPGEIAQMTVTTSSVVLSGGGTSPASTAEEWSFGDQWRAVTNLPSGNPDFDQGFGASGIYTVVSYLTRTWALQSGIGRPAAPVQLVPGARGCDAVAAALPSLFNLGPPGSANSASSLPTTVATALRIAVSCGILTDAGRQRVDGAEAIELTSRPDSPIPETIWVSPDSYLPVRVVTGPPAAKPGPWQTADITWLPPTAQNLAKLTVPVPAGFRQVSLVVLFGPKAEQKP